MEVGVEWTADDDWVGSSLLCSYGSEGQPGLKICVKEMIDEIGRDVGHVCEDDHDLVVVLFHNRQACDNGGADALPEACVFDDPEFGVITIGLKMVQNLLRLETKDQNHKLQVGIQRLPEDPIEKGHAPCWQHLLGFSHPH